MPVSATAAGRAFELMNKAGQYPALSSFFLETATDADGSWPLSVFIFDLCASLLVLTMGFYAAKSPSMPPKRLSWVLSALTSMTTATLSMFHVHKLYKHDWDGAIMFTDDRLSRFTVTFFVAYLLLDLLLGCTSRNHASCYHVPHPSYAP